LSASAKEFAVFHTTSEWAARFGASGRRAIISIGNFDGLHLGHQKILRGVVDRARDSGAIAAVVTFDPHPVKVLRPAQAPLLLETMQQRLAGFAALSLDAALVLHFDATLAGLPAEDFVRRILVDPVRASAILVGAAFRFGFHQAGDVALLKQMGAQLDFTVEVVEPVICDGQVISSTAIRKAIAEGHVAAAARLLGRPFALTGQVVRGAGRGATVLVPTLNLAPEQELIPASGVYATETVVDGHLYRSATNIGFRPTFNGTHRSIESHLFEFSRQIIEGPLEVRFWERLREERRFNSPDELLAQIRSDLDHARAYFRLRDASPITAEQI
jgi:riboflavin kinase/FMN adenylyltransferase